MNNKAGILIFLAGAAVGVASTWVAFKTKYEQIAREEIDAIKDVYYKEKYNVKKYNDIIADNGYSGGDSLETSPANGEEEEELEQPYVITPDEFDTLGYETRSLDYYADGVLVDECDEVIEDAEDLIGDGLEHFGEYEQDSVFVRDDILRVDYEILRDLRPHSEVW